MAQPFSDQIHAYGFVGADAEVGGLALPSLLDSTWWRTCEIDEIRAQGSLPRWRLRDNSDRYGLAITSLARDFSAAAMLFSLTVQKGDTPSPAALVRLSVNTGQEEPQAWDLTFDPTTGASRAAAANGRVFGRLTDNLDGWRATIAALVRPEVSAEVQACIAPAIGPSPGVYAPDAHGEIVIRDLNFRRLRIDQFLRLTARWTSNGAPG